MKGLWCDGLYLFRQELAAELPLGVVPLALLLALLLPALPVVLALLALLLPRTSPRTIESSSDHSLTGRDPPKHHLPVVEPPLPYLTTVPP